MKKLFKKAKNKAKSSKSTNDKENLALSSMPESMKGILGQNFATERTYSEDTIGVKAKNSNVLFDSSEVNDDLQVGRFTTSYG